MRQHVVHLSGQPLPFGQSGRPGLRHPALRQLQEENFGLLVRLSQPDGQEHQPKAPSEGAQDDEAGQALAAEPDEHLEDHEGDGR